MSFKMCVFVSGCVLYMVIFGGIIRSYGIFFLEFQQWYSADAAVVALMLSIQNIINSVIGIYIYIEVQKCQDEGVSLI